MGSCLSLFKFQCGDALVNRCWDCIAERAYVCNLEDNLRDLRIEKEKLSKLKDDAVEMVINGLVVGPLMEQKNQVEGWVERVNRKIAEVDPLLIKGESETEKLLCGCCSKNCISSYRIGKGVAQRLKEVTDLINDGDFKEVVMIAPARQLEANLRALRTLTDELEALVQDTGDRIRSDEGPERKPLQQVIQWISDAERAITEARDLLVNGEQETNQLKLGDISKLNFATRVAKSLEDVVSQKAKGSFQEVASKAPIEPDYVSKLRTTLADIKTKIEELRALKEEVKYKFTLSQGPQKKPLPLLERWYFMVDETTVEAHELIRDGPQEITKLRLKDYSNYKEFQERVTKTLNDAVALIVDGNSEKIIQGALPLPVIERNYQSPLGMENSLDEAWSLLNRKDVSIIGIHGIGGVGKTTLLNQINNDFLRDRRGFDIVINVKLPKDAKTENIQEYIMQRIGFLDKQWLQKSISDKADDIFSQLRYQKFVLLLDNIWKRFDLEEIGIPIPNIKNGSKIVVTTRSEAVCGQIRAHTIKVKPLDWENSWKLFQENVGYIAEDIVPAECVLLQKNVARKCGGLPKALIAIGRAMTQRKEPEEWEDALDVLNFTYKGMELEIIQDMEVEVFKPLMLSYDYLPNDTLKSCFLYCCLFPDGFKFFKDDLIHYWIGEELVFTRNEGYNIIGTLILASLLEEEEEGGRKYVEMHDVIHDLALWIACKHEKEKENYFVEAGRQLIKAPEVGKWKGAKRISFMRNDLREMPEVPECNHLLTLFLCDNPLQHFTEGFFRSMKVLIVLDLSKTGIKMLPVEISNLLSLQYLNLSHTSLEELPIDLRKLEKLKYLNLEDTRVLIGIPKALISGLSSLQVLLMFDCSSLPENLKSTKGDVSIFCDGMRMIEEMNGLENLNGLSITIKNNSSLQRYLSSDKLIKCSTRAIFLGFPDDLLSIDDLISLAKLKNLEKIGMSWHAKLEKLNVDGLLGKISFDSLREVNIEFCHTLINLNWLVLAPNLMVLKVAFCAAMKEIISGQNVSEVPPKVFSNLHSLSLRFLQNLEMIYQTALSFPCLKRIAVFYCPKLKKLPLNCNSARGCNVEILGNEQWWKDIEWEDYATKDTFRNSFIS